MRPHVPLCPAAHSSGEWISSEWPVCQICVLGAAYGVANLQGGFAPRIRIQRVLSTALRSLNTRICFRAFRAPTISIEQGTDSCQAGLKIERRVRVERQEVRPIEVSALKTSPQANAGAVRPTA